MKGYKMGAFIFLAAALWFATNYAYSSEKHHDIVNTPVIVNIDTNLPGPLAVTNITSSKGIASAISAAQCHFDGGSIDLQLCGGYGNTLNQSAYTFGVGQKMGNFLFNFTETIESGQSSHGFGVNLKVKFK